MKILTANFVTCAVKTCKVSQDSYPLHFRDAELEHSDIEYNPSLIRNILPRVDWEALKITATELGFDTVPADKPDFVSTAVSPDDVDSVNQGEVLQNLHNLLLATEVREGKMVCGNCGHEYNIKEGIANFLLPSHLV